MTTRIESDSMGDMEVPAEALYGASTQRAALNFPISGLPVDPGIVRAYGLIKWAAARTNGELGHVPKEKTDLIERAAEEVIEGKLDAEFPVDVFQTGSGTSTNMNANEVIANRCAQLAGVGIDAPRDEKPVHPNDHVNQGQSSNDTFPTAMHIAVGTALKDALNPGPGAPRGIFGREGGGVRLHSQDRADPSHGRHPGALGAGVRWFCPAGGAGGRSRPQGPQGDP